MPLRAEASKKVTWSTRGILGGTAVLAIATLLGKFITLLRDASVAAEFGATRTSDELMLAQLYPAIICGVAAGAVALALPPAVEMARKRTGRQPSFRQVSGIAGLCMGALLVAGVSSFLWARPLLSLTAQDWSATDVDTTAGYVAGFFLFSWLSAATSLVAVFLTTRKLFLAGGLAVAFNGLFASIVVLTLGGRLGGEALVIGSIIDGACGLAIVLVVLGGVSRGARGARPERIEWGALRAIAMPAIAVSVMTTIPLLVERSAAASLTPGDVAVLGWAQKLAALPLGLAISLPLSQAVYPSLARREEHRDDSPDLGLGSVSGYYALVGLSSICAAIRSTSPAHWSLSYFSMVDSTRLRQATPPGRCAFSSSESREPRCSLWLRACCMRAAKVVG